MQRKICVRHEKDYPCSCGIGNLYRFVEPVILLLLQKRGHSCGYNLCADLREHALTDAEIEKAALCRTLRQLEKNGSFTSAWEAGEDGPARCVYKLTKDGEEHLEEWAAVFENPLKVDGPLCARDTKGPADSGVEEDPEGMT